MSANFTIITSWELFSNFLCNKLTVWLIFSNGSHSKLAIFEYFWNNGWLSDSASTELTKGRSLLELRSSSLERVLIFLLCLSGSQESFDIWVLNHKVKSIRASTFELNRTW